MRMQAEIEKYLRALSLQPLNTPPAKRAKGEWGAVVRANSIFGMDGRRGDCWDSRSIVWL